METFHYDVLGRETQHASDLGTFTLTYLGQTDQIVSRVLGGSATLATTWSYLGNQNDRRLSAVNNTGLGAPQTSNFAIGSNVLGQVTSVTQSSDTAPSSPASDSRTLTYNTVNEAVTLNGQALTYDANGNLLSDGTRHFAWDADNRLPRNQRFPILIQKTQLKLRPTQMAHLGVGKDNLHKEVQKELMLTQTIRGKVSIQM